MAEKSALLCLRWQRDLVLCPRAGGLELGGQGRWEVEMGEAGPGGGNGNCSREAVLAYFKLPVVLGCKCLHLCKPLAKSVNTSRAEGLSSRSGQRTGSTNPGGQKDLI